MSKKNKNGEIGADSNKRFNDLIEDLAPIKGKKPELIYEGGIEVLDNSDNATNNISNIGNSLSKNLSIATLDKKETHSSNGEVNLAEQFIKGKLGDALDNLSGGINCTSPSLKIEEAVLIKHSLDEMMENPTKKQIINGCNYIDIAIEIATKNPEEPTIERKKFLESIKKLFTTIREGCEKNFDNAKNGINFSFEKVKSLGKDKITAITDQKHTR